MTGALHEKINNKTLAWVLGGLCAVVIILVIVVLINVLTPHEQTGQTEDDSSMTEDDRKYYSFVDDYNNTNSKADEMMNENPVDTDAIDQIYIEKYNQYINEDPDRSNSFLRSWVKKYIAKGMKEEALNAYEKVNLELLAPAQQYRRYTALIELARELGRNDLVSKYEPLQAKTKEAYDLDYQDSLNAEAEAEAQKQQSEEENPDEIDWGEEEEY